MEPLTFRHLSLSVDDTALTLAIQQRDGEGTPILSLHGFGSTKEDYADLAHHPAFTGRRLIAYDAPGCGASAIDDATAVSIPFLVEVARAVCDALNLEQVHLTGHSMGGLTGLLFADAYPGRVTSFFDIEGNLAPEDCFLSRQIVSHGATDDDAFLAGFIERVRSRAEYGSGVYAASLPAKVHPAVVRPIFESMVRLSDEAPLLDIMAALQCPRAFVHGDGNRGLSYLPGLPGKGVTVIEIAQSGHFPMYSNPPALWAALARFIDEAETKAPHGEPR